MKQIIIFLVFSLILASCNTIEKETVININWEEKIEKKVSESIISKELITEESTNVYDLTVLKGGSYPKIRNNTPFSDIELKILKNSSGLEMEANIEVAHYFKYFLRDKKDLLKLWIENSRPYIPAIRKSFQENNLPIELIFLPFLESGYNVKAYSRAGAGGIWQFMPKTAISYGLTINWWTDERRNPRLVTPYAIKHLKYLNKLFGNWYSALAAYNAGEGRVSRAMKKVNIYDYFELIKTDALPKETRRYIYQYMAIVKIMKNLKELGLAPIDWSYNNENTTIKIPGGTDLYKLSSALKITWRNFIMLNPSFRRKVSDPAGFSTIIIPETSEQFALKYIKNNKPIITNGDYNYYVVKSGDSWWYLAKLTNKSILSLKRLNNLSSNNLKIGQRLLLPGNWNYITSSLNTTYKKDLALQTYKVKNGDTISSISIKYNIKLYSLYTENSLSSRSILKIGQIIKLPGYPLISSKTLLTHNSYYTVKNGDSVWLIAEKTEIPYKKLLNINNLDSNSRLKIGDKLLLY